MIWPDTIRMAIETIESAPFLTDTQKRDILYNNAARFLRLTAEQIRAHHSSFPSQAAIGDGLGQDRGRRQ
jgi:hypothetical protein